jgi:hypothetical protein
LGDSASDRYGHVLNPINFGLSRPATSPGRNHKTCSRNSSRPGLRNDRVDFIRRGHPRERPHTIAAALCRFRPRNGKVQSLTLSDRLDSLGSARRNRCGLERTHAIGVHNSTK